MPRTRVFLRKWSDAEGVWILRSALVFFVAGSDVVDGPSRVIHFPRTYRLEKTNFKVIFKSGADAKAPLQLTRVLDCLKESLEAIGVDVIRFRNEDSVVSATPASALCTR